MRGLLLDGQPHLTVLSFQEMPALPDRPTSHPLPRLPAPPPQVELKVLEHLRSHDPEDAHNVIHISENFMFRGHLCITFEMLSINL